MSALVCPACGAASNEGDVFCEACGADLPASGVPAAAPASAPAPSAGGARCASCGADGQLTPDGYCGVCGMKQPAQHDHEEFVVTGAAAVTDRGKHHPRNEDAVALDARADGRVVAVVCDGVSMTVDPDKASAAAVAAAIGVLRDAPMDHSEAVSDALVAAFLAARDAVQAVSFMPEKDLGDPSCTFLAAVASPPGNLVVASLGDCRAYWLADDFGDEKTLTDDDSWADDEVEAHVMTEQAAYNDPRAHMITRWLGRDSDPTWRPAIRQLDAKHGRLLLCSDGLWNYTLEHGQVAAAAMGAEPEPLAVARRLVNFANKQGGHDNISVVVVDLPVSCGDTKGL